MKNLKDKGELAELAQMGIRISEKMNRFQAQQISNPALELGENKFVEKGK